MICSILKEKTRCCHQSWTLCKSMLVKKNQSLLLPKLLLGIGITARSLHMQKMKGYMFVEVLK
jgi:hypothetical protein